MRFAGVLLLLMTSLLAGCQLPAPQTADAFAALRKDMTGPAVRELLGAPAEVRAFKSEPFRSEIWIYHRKLRGEEREVPIRIQEVPAVNPLTGQPFTRQEPVYETQVTTITETVELLLVEDRLVAWKTLRQTGSGIEAR